MTISCEVILEYHHTEGLADGSGRIDGTGDGSGSSNGRSQKDRSGYGEDNPSSNYDFSSGHGM